MLKSGHYACPVCGVRSIRWFLCSVGFSNFIIHDFQHIGNWPNDFSCQWWTCRMCGRSMTEKSQRHRCQVKHPQLRLDPIITLSFQGEYQNMACAVQCRDCLKEGLGKFHILGTEKKQASYLILNSTHFRCEMWGVWQLQHHKGEGSSVEKRQRQRSPHPTQLGRRLLWRGRGWHAPCPA